MAEEEDDGPEPFVVELERFHGPLDLLLHLIRSQDIDIFDIPIARITEQFQAALSAGLDRLELDRAGEFLEMASTLVRIKAQLLIPRNESPDWEEDPRADLVRRLLEYEHFQEVAQVLMSGTSPRDTCPGFPTRRRRRRTWSSRSTSSWRRRGACPSPPRRRCTALPPAGCG